jgi:hypothetical protein
MFVYVYLSNRAAGLFRLAAFVSLALMVIVAATASAAPTQQSGGLDPSLSENFGSVSLSPGFMPDPYTVSLESGGSVSASSVGCMGYVTRAPDFELTLTDTSSRLRIFFFGYGDTTLIINDANGNWRCNDDYEDQNPLVELVNAPSGTYDIWVGSYTRGTGIDGTLYITERAISPTSLTGSNSSDNQRGEDDITGGDVSSSSVYLNFGVVCIVNDTNATVNYSYRWGNGSWSDTSIPPGNQRWHSYELIVYLNEVPDPNADHQPDFVIRFDERLSDGDYFKEYTLDRDAAADENCDEGHEYSFQYVNDSRIDLYDTE